MEPNDVSQSVTAEQSVNEGFASPDAGEGQSSAQEGDKEYNFRKLETDRDQYRDEAVSLKKQVEERDNMLGMYKAMGQQSQNPKPEQPAPISNELRFDDAVDSEAFNKLGGYLQQQAGIISQQTRTQQDQMEQMELRFQDKNWRVVVDKYLPGAIKEEPWIADDIRNSPTNAWKKAYFYATKNTSYLKDKMAGQQSEEAARMVKNAEKPKTLGTTGTQSNVGGHRDAFDMSNEEFEAVKRKLVAGKLN